MASPPPRAQDGLSRRADQQPRSGRAADPGQHARRAHINELRLIANAIDPLTINIKQMGYRLARELAAALPPATGTVARKQNLPNGLSTQAAMESDWVAHWCSQLGVPVAYHRKLWELCFVLQTLFDADMIAPGRKGLGFGCGPEPLPSYLAAHGVAITATDCRPSAPARKAGLRTDRMPSPATRC